ncbi:MAG: toxin-antitoxin system HicB family antitoxin [Alphaproteobacteria bacterium]|nr:toxin-antitoxin system HicB family antitoxin [Alphaproteobacteria bacterium]
MNHDHYTYRTSWSSESNEFIGACSEFPLLTWLDASPELAMAGIRKLVAEIIEDMKKSGETPPTPFIHRNYSGQFMVRVPSVIHRNLATEAAEQGVSLNRLVAAKLS